MIITEKKLNQIITECVRRVKKQSMINEVEFTNKRDQEFDIDDSEFMDWLEGEGYIDKMVNIMRNEFSNEIEDYEYNTDEEIYDWCKEYIEYIVAGDYGDSPLDKRLVSIIRDAQDEYDDGYSGELDSHGFSSEADYWGYRGF